MPSSRRLRITGLVAVLIVLIIFYTTNGARSTSNSPFYTRTVDALRDRQETEARQHVIEKEKQQLERVERLQKEHDVAVSVAAAADTASPKNAAGDDHAGKAAEKQDPLAADTEDAGRAAPDAVADKVKPVAGRKTMAANKDKVVPTKPADDEDDGVAKVGNVAPKASSALTSDDGLATEEDRQVETELTDILKKGPIIIFSKSYCPFSKKAKHILLDLYTITPPPYVVELDEHELGSGLQDALEKSTGRSTVPNVLINGKSIGGGDDVEALHKSDKLADTISSMGGKRVVGVTKNEASGPRTEVKFKG